MIRLIIIAVLVGNLLGCGAPPYRDSPSQVFDPGQKQVPLVVHNPRILNSFELCIKHRDDKERFDACRADIDRKNVHEENNTNLTNTTNVKVFESFEASKRQGQNYPQHHPNNNIFYNNYHRPSGYYGTWW